MRAVVSWSGGKDSALALHEIVKAREIEVSALLTTLSEDGRVSAHGVPVALIEEQARALGLPLHKVLLPAACSNQEYESRMRIALTTLRREVVETVISGDIFLEDVRTYRESLVRSAGMTICFPLWGRDTAGLADAFLANGFKAIVCTVDGNLLPADFVGRQYDEAFLSDLPRGVDPCGENGEFHTFVFDGPRFEHPVRFTSGETVLAQGRFYSCDLLPQSV